MQVEYWLWGLFGVGFILFLYWMMRQQLPFRNPRARVVKIAPLLEKGRRLLLQLTPQFKLWELSEANPFFWSEQDHVRDVVSLLQRYTAQSEVVRGWWGNVLFLAQKTEIAHALADWDADSCTKRLLFLIERMVNEWSRANSREGAEKVVQVFTDVVRMFRRSKTSTMVKLLVWVLLDTLYCVTS